MLCFSFSFSPSARLIRAEWVSVLFICACFSDHLMDVFIQQQTYKLRNGKYSKFIMIFVRLKKTCNNTKIILCVHEICSRKFRWRFSNSHCPIITKWCPHSKCAESVCVCCFSFSQNSFSLLLCFRSWFLDLIIGAYV